MGIQGLIPFSKKAIRSANIKEFKGTVAAVDTYTLIYKGAFAAADEVILNPSSDIYVKYVLKRIHQLLDAGIKPILIFDGRILPIKSAVEEKRRAMREANLKKGFQFLSRRDNSSAKECFRKALNVTPEMAKNVINAIRDIGLDYIVAPYEADAQLAFLSLSGVADLVITEDSDLIVFGCSKIIFKLDGNGSCCLYDSVFLPDVVEFGTSYSFDRFRWMCILSGCDYLENIPGVGLITARKILKKTKKSSLDAVFTHLKLDPKFSLVSNKYFENFIKADNTFKYQLIFDPFSMTLKPLNPYPLNFEEDLNYCGPVFANEIAFQQAIGNYNFSRGFVDDDFVLPFKIVTFPSGFSNENSPAYMQSIFSESYEQRSRPTACMTTKSERTRQKSLVTVFERSTEKPASPVKQTPRTVRGKVKLDAIDKILAEYVFDERAYIRSSDENDHDSSQSALSISDNFDKGKANISTVSMEKSNDICNTKTTSIFEKLRYPNQSFLDHKSDITMSALKSPYFEDNDFLPSDHLSENVELLNELSCDLADKSLGDMSDLSSTEDVLHSTRIEPNSFVALRNLTVNFEELFLCSYIIVLMFFILFLHHYVNSLFAEIWKFLVDILEHFISTLSKSLRTML